MARLAITRIIAALMLGVVVVVHSVAPQHQNPVKVVADPMRTIRPFDSPEPYSPEEFPQFALSLRRFQIITIGVFPFALLFSGLGYELGRFGYYSARAGGVDGRYAPRLFGAGAGTEPLSNDERIGVVLAAVSLSVVVGIADYLLGRRERGRSQP